MSRLALLALLVSGPALAVIGGDLDSGDLAVVSLARGDRSACTGALIAPDVVLTAGHCVNGFTAGEEIVFGADVAHPVDRIGVLDWFVDPRFTAEGAPYDFALVRLAHPSEVPPLPLATVAVDPTAVGGLLRHVGFGVSDEVAGTGSGLKREVTYPVTRVDGMLVYSGAPGQQTCSGDSGAPALWREGDREVLLAVVSDGPDCHSDGWDDQVTYTRDFIDRAQRLWAEQPVPRECSAAPGAPAGWLAALSGLAALRRRAAAPGRRSVRSCR